MHSNSFDFYRIFWGDTTLPLLLEIAFRTVVMYIYALVLLRFVSRRGFGNLSLFEIIIIIALGAAIGEPIIDTHIPLARAFLVAAVVIAVMRATVFMVSRSDRMEDIVEGTATRIVSSTRLDRDGMHRAGYSQEEVALKLRLGGIQHLGQVKGAYVESNGEVSIFTYPPGQVQSGLPIVPPWDVAMPQFFIAGKDKADRNGYSCLNCGNTIRVHLEQLLPVCPACDKSKWVYTWDCLKEHEDYNPPD